MAPVMVSWGSRAGRSARLCGANSADGMRAGLALCRCRDMASARSVADRLCRGNHDERALRAKTRQASCRCDRTLPLYGSFGSEFSQCGSGDEVALKVEGIVDGGMHAEEALGGSS